MPDEASLREMARLAIRRSLVSFSRRWFIAVAADPPV